MFDSNPNTYFNQNRLLESDARREEGVVQLREDLQVVTLPLDDIAEYRWVLCVEKRRGGLVRLCLSWYMFVRRMGLRIRATSIHQPLLHTTTIHLQTHNTGA